MVPASQIVDFVKTAYRWAHSDIDATILSLINSVQRDIAPLFPWQVLRSQIDLAGGAWLPSDLVGIIDVRDTERAYTGRDEAVSGPTEQDPLYKWFYSDISSVPLVTARGIHTENANRNVAFDPAAATTYQDQYIRIGTEPAIFKISAMADTAAAVLETEWWGQNLANAYYEIRPAGTRRIGLADYDGNALAATVTVHYWRLPQHIFHPFQAVVLPARAVELGVLVKMIGTIDKKESTADRYRAEYVAEISRAMRDQRGHVAARPTDKLGRRVSFNSRENRSTGGFRYTAN